MMGRNKGYETLSHSCNSAGQGYDNLINAVFVQAYDDLTSAIRKACRFHAMAKAETRTMLKWKLQDEAARYMRDANALKKWFREVMPCWRDINPQLVIDRAYKECENDTEAVFATDPKSQG